MQVKAESVEVLLEAVVAEFEFRLLDSGSVVESLDLATIAAKLELL